MVRFSRSAYPRGDVAFRRAFLLARRLPDATYERALFFECASLHTLVLALLLEDRGVGAFAVERVLMERVAAARTMDDVSAALCSYRRRAFVRHGWMRRLAGIGISPRRLARVAKECLPCNEMKPAPPRRAA